MRKKIYNHSEAKEEKSDKKVKETIQKKIIIATLSIMILIILIFGSLNFMIFNKDFYHKEYIKNGSYTNLLQDKGIQKATVDNITDNILKFFRSNTELQYFTSAEKSHMNDVKKLINLMQYIYYAAALLTIALFFYCYKKYKEDKYEFVRVLSKSLLYSSIASIILLVLIFLMAVFDFSTLFITFHYIFFPQGNWTFESSTLLISLFPEQFFFDISLRIFIYAMFQSLIFFGIGYWMHKQLKIVEKHYH